MVLTLTIGFGKFAKVITHIGYRTAQVVECPFVEIALKRLKRTLKIDGVTRSVFVTVACWKTLMRKV